MPEHAPAMNVAIHMAPMRQRIIVPSPEGRTQTPSFVASSPIAIIL